MPCMVNSMRTLLGRFQTMVAGTSCGPKTCLAFILTEVTAAILSLPPSASKCLARTSSRVAAESGAVAIARTARVLRNRMEILLSNRYREVPLGREPGPLELEAVAARAGLAV